jgi:hypothetical protein
MYVCMYDITGVPDAYENNLESHEVFVYVPLLRGGSINSCRPYIECDVLVTRHPMHHPGDIRKLRAVRNEKLLELCRGTTNPVIFFSIRGERSQADCMGGGDFDGDKYIVIANEEIVKQLNKEADPYPVDAVSTSSKGGGGADVQCASSSSSSSSSSSNQWPLSYHLFQALFADSLNDDIGLNVIHWLAVADLEGPDSERAIRLDQKCRLSLDATKKPAAAATSPLSGGSSRDEKPDRKPDWMTGIVLYSIVMS